MQIKVGKTSNYFGSQKQSNIWQFMYHVKEKWKLVTWANLHIFIFWGEISAIHINFQFTKYFKMKRAVRFWINNMFYLILPPMSDLTPFYGIRVSTLRHALRNGITILRHIMSCLADFLKTLSGIWFESKVPGTVFYRISDMRPYFGQIWLFLINLVSEPWETTF